jgi:hypothetical protein
MWPDLLFAGMRFIVSGFTTTFQEFQIGADGT